MVAESRLSERREAYAPEPTLTDLVAPLDGGYILPRATPTAGIPARTV